MSKTGKPLPQAQEMDVLPEPRQSMDGIRWWTWEETEYLKHLRFEKNLSLKACAVRLNRTVSSVHGRLSDHIRRKGERYHPRYFTRDEDARLKELWPYTSIPRIAEELGRDRRSITWRAQWLGLMI